MFIAQFEDNALQVAIIYFITKGGMRNGMEYGTEYGMEYGTTHIP